MRPMFGVMVMCALMLPNEALAQQRSWTNSNRTVRVVFPIGWEPHSGNDTRFYAPRQELPIAGSVHRRRVSGLLQPRYLTAGVHLITDRKRVEVSLTQIARMLEERIGQAYELTTRDYTSRDGMALLAYQFIHTGTPVTQALIVFGDQRGSVYMLELTGHRRDNELVIGAARQILHSIEVRQGSERTELSGVDLQRFWRSATICNSGWGGRGVCKWRWCGRLGSVGGTPVMGGGFVLLSAGEDLE